MLILILTLRRAAGQPVQTGDVRPMTVCQALRELKTLNGRTIAIRGVFRFTHRHGGWMLDENNGGKPCGNMPRKARIWQSAIWLESVEEAKLNRMPVAFVEEPPTYADIIRESDQLATNHQNLTATFVGEIRTKKDLVIVPHRQTEGIRWGTATASEALSPRPWSSKPITTCTSGRSS
jgi:hypothetical protein